MRVTQTDFEALQRTILELHEHRDLNEFRKAMPGIFLRLIPADHFSLVTYHLNAVTGQIKLVDCLESAPKVTREVIPHWEQRVWEHPFTRYFVRGGEATALKFSDFFTMTQLKHSQFWELICKVLHFDRGISLPVSIGAGTSAVSLGRCGKDFTERDRLILNLIRPHFEQAYRNASMNGSRRRSKVGALSKYGLRPREIEVASWVASGKTNPEIALILQISPRTVEKHMENILQKLKVENRAAAAVLISRCSNHDL
jgi:DNA-binding CsgD family transcriptional regulator